MTSTSDADATNGNSNSDEVAILNERIAGSLTDTLPKLGGGSVETRLILIIACIISRDYVVCTACVVVICSHY